MVRDGCGAGWEGVCLAVGLRQDIVPRLEVEGERWEDVCREVGFEWVDGEARGRNEFNGEYGGRLFRFTLLEGGLWFLLFCCGFFTFFGAGKG